MKKIKNIKVFSLAILLIFIILITLGFIKLPINALSSEKIKSETKGLILLNSFEKQSLLLLPSPKVELIKSIFTINHSLFKADLIIPEAEFSRSLFNTNKISINIKETDLENIKTNIIKNPILLEDEIENLEIKILNNQNTTTTSIKSNSFRYKGAEISFDAQLEESLIKKISFSIKDLDIDELILLLDEKYQKYFKEINFSSLDIEGEYALNSIILKRFELKMEDETSINLEGFIDTLNISNSDISISGVNFSSKNLFKILKNFNLNIDEPSISDGLLKIFNISFKEGKFKLNEIDYESNLGSNIKLKGEIKDSIILNNNFDIQIHSSSTEEIINILNEIFPSNEFKEMQIDEFNMIASINESLLNITSLNLINGQSFIEVSGDLNLSDFNKRNLRIKLLDFDKFDLLPDKYDSSEMIKSLGVERVNIEIFLSDNDLEILKFEMLDDDKIFLNLVGEVNLNNFNETFLSVESNNLDTQNIGNILASFNQKIYLNFLDLINFDKIKGNMFIDLNNKTSIIENLDIVEDGEIIGNISGKILDKRFMGSAYFENIDISKLDENFLNLDRLSGSLNIEISIPEYVNVDNFQTISGSIEGVVDIKVSDDELALVIFMQTLSQDIEDFEQINSLLTTLSKSFINKEVSVNGSINNEIKNKILINNIKITSQNGEILNCEIEYEDKDYKLTVFDIIENDDFVIKYQNGSYSYERIISNGIVRKPVEELIQKNINKLFENLLK